MLNNPRSPKGVRFASGTLEGADPHMLGGFVGPPKPPDLGRAIVEATFAGEEMTSARCHVI